MTLKERIQEDMKAALRGGERERLATVRLILAAIKQREVDERISLDDAQVLAVIEKMVKQRRESIASFQSGGRADLVAKEQAELNLLHTYLPEPLDDAAIDALIGTAIAESGATSVKDMGKVMALIKSRAAGRVDMSALGTRVRSRLT
ncbi:MAG TPA: GatB/YqeY domain-containing protein [Steroidobacteraceae bacterium]|nr:GatB/YqeY domain-containing protein [Steroidobacteraceae bacterium]